MPFGKIKGFVEEKFNFSLIVFANFKKEHGFLFFTKFVSNVVQKNCRHYMVKHFLWEF